MEWFNRGEFVWKRPSVGYHFSFRFDWSQLYAPLQAQHQFNEERNQVSGGRDAFWNRSCSCVECWESFRLYSWYVYYVEKLFSLRLYIPAIVKPLVRSEMLNKVHFYRSDMNYEKFYKDCIPRSHLPSDYGGYLASVKVLHQEQRKSLLKLRDYFVFEEMQANLIFDEFVDDFLDDVNF